jgi:dTDP-6-deoxy-L-talose 4-dehydrogenase (NAD+)
MKIAVTGASGFIGRHVVSSLSQHGAEIIVVTRDAGRLYGLDAKISIVEMDIAKSPLDSFEQLGSPDALIHLAWDGLPNYRSLHHFEKELPMHYHFLKTMIGSGLRSLLVTGTCFEYGMQSGCLNESMLPQPNNPYGFAKNALRQQLQYLKLSKPFNLTWARLFYMYGEGQSTSSLYSKLKEAVLRGDKIFNMSGGEQLRDYLSVEEVASNLVWLAISQQDIGVVNVCSGIPISVRKLVERWMQEKDWDIKLNLGYYPYPDYEPMAFWGDRRRLDNILGRHRGG